MNKGVRKNHGNVGRRLAGIVLTLVMVLGMCAGLTPEGTGEVQASKTTGTSGHVADAGTTTNYVDVLDTDTNSTRYSGRVWTDKTVSTDSISFSGDIAGGTTIQNDSDFLVAYSALGISQEIVGWPPTDTVFILDFSASMCWNRWGPIWDEEDREWVYRGQVGKEDGSDSRIKYMIDALNEAIDTLAKASPYNRIAIVTFNATADILMPLREVTVREDKDYLELEGFTGTTGEDDGVATVKCNINNETDVTASVTNIQTGLYRGMNILASESETTATFGDETVTRIPNVVLMSDGAPTTFAPANGTGDLESRPAQRVESGNWWEGVQNKAIGYGDNNNPHSANGFMPLLTASYMKNAITDHYYGGLNTGREANVYTIGFGIDQQTDDMVEMANLVLNPAENMSGAQNEEIQDVIDAWNTYRRGYRQVEVEGLTPSSDGYRPPFTYIVERADDSLNPTTLEYPTAYFAAEDSDSLNDAFTQIAKMITEQAKVPTQVWGDETASGYITYTDPIGEYMEVKDVKTIILGGIRFDRVGEKPQPVEDQDGNKVTTYRFEGGVDSPVYGNHDVSEISITVTEDANGMQTLKAEIPASVIPVRVYTIERETNGTITNTSNNAYPIRILYEVGLKDGIVDENGIINSDVVSQDYINKNGDGQGGIYFYSNLYSGEVQGENDEERTVGNAYTTFTPAEDNPFYFVQDSIPLYMDEKLTEAARQYDRNATYYFGINYYDSAGRQTAVVSRAADLMESYTFERGGQLYLRAGAPRLGNLLDVVDESKGVGANQTNTAEALLYPTFAGSVDVSSPDDAGYFKIYHGNNGRLTVKNSASLAITKLVETSPEEGITAPDAEFTFEVTVESMVNKDNVPATVVNSDNTETVKNLQFDSEGKATFTLEAGQTITIPGLTVGESYTIKEVKEKLPDGFSLKAGEEAIRSGTLAVGTNSVTYTNVYTRTGSITITKRDGAGKLLEGAGFTLYAGSSDPSDGQTSEIVQENAMVYLAEVVTVNISDENYNQGTNRYTEDGVQYIVHKIPATGTASERYIYYCALNESEISAYREGQFGGEVEAVVEFTNLPIGTYYIEETIVPEDYIKAPDITNITIPKTVSGSTDVSYDLLYTVENHKNLVLPTTGLDGIGMIVAIGVLFIAGGGGYFMLRAIGNSGRKRHHG